MRKIAFLISPLFLIFLLLMKTSMSDQAEDLGQATLTMHATVLGHSHWADKDCKYDDEVTITVTERVQFRIVAIPNGALDLEIASHQNSFSASGGGTLKGKNCDSAWTYHIKDHLENSVAGVWVNLGTGRGAFLIGDSFIKDADLSSTLVVAGNAIPGGIPSAGYAAWKVVDEPFMAISQAAKDFMKQLEFSFKPYSKNVSANRSADYAYQLPTPETPASAELHMEFSLVTGAQEDSEAEIIPPDDYASWMPEGGQNEDDPANIIAIRVRVYKKGQPQKPSPQAATFKFQLAEVSQEKGVCLNWPHKEAKKSFDLKIQKEWNGELTVASDGQSATSKGNLSESSVKISSYDWGAYGKLKVTAIYDDGHEEEAHVLGDPSKHELTIPKDDNDNHIADWWDKTYGGKNLKETADADQVPRGNGDDGDGLTLYEEYRGFMLEGEHERTDPLLKDVFIHDGIGYGWGDFMQSGLAPHLVSDDEYSEEGGAPNPAVINPNRGFAKGGPQYVLRLVNAQLNGANGKAEGGPGTPRTIEAVQIDVASCLGSGGADELRSTTAHELAHGCNVWHHGQGDYGVFKVRQWLADSGTWGPWMGLRDDGSWAPPGGYIPEVILVAAQGGQESGVETCIMRYEGTQFYESPDGDYQWERRGSLKRGRWYPPFEPPGHIFCDDPKGTGVNAEGREGGSKAGDATMGNCLGQFCVKASCRPSKK